MAVFVAECSYSGECLVVASAVVSSGKFRAAGISVHHFPIKRHCLSGAFKYIPGVRPYTVFTGSLRFVCTCKEYEDIVYLAILVIVIYCEINVIVHCLTGFYDHLSGILVLAVCHITAIISHLPGKCHYLADIESEVDQSRELLVEIFLGAAGGTV